MQINVYVKDANKVEQLLANFDKVDQIMLEEIQLAVVMARNRASVKSGYMRDNIEITDIDFANGIIVVASLAHYSSFVEWGTCKMHARPFFTQPMWNALFRIYERINELLEIH